MMHRRHRKDQAFRKANAVTNKCFYLLPIISLFTSIIALFSSLDVASENDLPETPSFPDTSYFRKYMRNANCDPGKWLHDADALAALTENGGIPDVETCLHHVLTKAECSKRWFIHGEYDGNCRCVPPDVDCGERENYRAHNTVNTYQILSKPWKPKNLRILYIVRTYPKTYESRLKLLEETWLQSITDDYILIVSIKNSYYQDHEISLIKPRHNLKIIYPECVYSGKSEGMCCQESNALVAALDFNFDWVFMVDDDVFLSPKRVKQLLREMPPWADVIGSWGCATEVHQHGVTYDMRGFCGGHGYALTRSALEHMVYDATKFLLEYHLVCEDVKLCDIVTGVIAERRRLGIHSFPFGNLINNYNKAVYHRIYGDKMYRLHAMLNLETEPFNFTYADYEHWKDIKS